jgi:hypothetical protein
MITLSRQLSSAHSERGIDNMNNKRTSRNFFAVAVLAFAAMASTGSQCARVDDSATGPSSNFLDTSGEVTGCIQACNETAREARRQANEDFHFALAACDSGSGCRSQAAAEHQAALEQINEEQSECKRGCHEQGSGSGGQ